MTLKGIRKLKSALEKLREASEEVRESLDNKRAWWDERSEGWQGSESGQNWELYLSDIEEFLDTMDDIDTPDILADN